MYQTCLYCAKDLGRNEFLEAMPTGRRLAFDAQRGRLWVVCRACVKWNLVPFEERFEAIDACERVFRATRTRFSTDNIGLAMIADVLELVRVGPALRPEFAAWRYGKDILQRRVPSWFGQAAARPTFRDPWTKQLIEVRVATVRDAELRVDDSGRWQLEVPYRREGEIGGYTDMVNLFPSIRDVPWLGLFRNADLFPTLGRILPAIDFRRARPDEVSNAVTLVEQVSDAAGLFPYVVGRPLKFATIRNYPLREITAEIRLALEMAAHEETERRVMEGELKLIERQWKAAEEIASISDRLEVGIEP